MCVDVWDVRACFDTYEGIKRKKLNLNETFMRKEYEMILNAADTGEILTLTLVLMTTVCVFMARETSIKKPGKQNKKY